MTPEQVTDAVCERMAQRLLPAVDAYGAQGEAELREIVSTQGTRKSRSKPGNPPYRQSGGYQNTMTHQTHRDGDRFTTEFGSTSPLADWLHNGTSRMAARPHFDVIYRRAQQNAAQQIKQNL